MLRHTARFLIQHGSRLNIYIDNLIHPFDLKIMMVICKTRVTGIKKQELFV